MVEREAMEETPDPWGHWFKSNNSYHIEVFGKDVAINCSPS